MLRGHFSLEHSCFALLDLGMRFANPIKHLVPSSLLGRSMLIVFVPVCLTLVVLISFFIDRIYQKATISRSSDAARVINYIIEDVENLDRPQALMRMSGKAVPLDIDVSILDVPKLRQSAYLFYDLSGSYVVATLQSQLPNPLFVDLTSDPRGVTINLEIGTHWVQVIMARSRFSTSNPHQMVLWTVFSTLLFLGVAYVFMRNQLRPITQLSKAAVAFGHGQRAHFTPRGTPELRHAGLAFLDMRNRIERHLEQRKNMLSGVSHDLRTPLTRMRLSLSLIEDETIVKDLKSDITEMESIIEEFLTFAHDDSQEDRTRINAISMVKSVLHDYERNGDCIELHIPNADQAAFEFDGRVTSIRRALNNLLGNALRFGQHIRLTITQRVKSIHFIIEDDGPGIAKVDLERATRPFERLDAARNRDTHVGAGLGLAIATDIARGHGGVLKLSHSKDLGGLRAELSVPIS